MLQIAEKTNAATQSFNKIYFMKPNIIGLKYVRRKCKPILWNFRAFNNRKKSLLHKKKSMLSVFYDYV